MTCPSLLCTLNRVTCAPCFCFFLLCSFSTFLFFALYLPFSFSSLFLCFCLLLSFHLYLSFFLSLFIYNSTSFPTSSHCLLPFSLPLSVLLFPYFSLYRFLFPFFYPIYILFLFQLVFLSFSFSQFHTLSAHVCFFLVGHGDSRCQVTAELIKLKLAG